MLTQTVEIQLKEQPALKLEEAARRPGVSVETLLHASIEEKLAPLEDDFSAAANYVLDKNAGLYRRLA